MKQVRSLDHVGVNVDDLEAATEFFLDLGLEREGATSVRGDWVGDIIGLKDVHSDIVMLRTADGSSKLELCRFRTPADTQSPEAAPANRLGIRHIAFVVDGLNEVLDRLGSKGFNTVGTVHDFEDVYRMCYVRGPEGIIVELAEEIDSAAAR
ncbi:MAG TPA: VOC family protein [Chloroflexota bacterium]|nr:VOC family protein [Chloroflexota bacterium]